MKTTLKTLSILCVLAIAISGCAKSNDAKPSTSSSSWTVSGATYKGSSTTFTNSELLSIDQNDSSQPIIGIQFSARPMVSGAYAVVNQYNTPPGTNQCSILTSNTANNTVLVSDAGGSVTVNVSSSGKLTVTCANIAMGLLGGVDNNGQFTFTAAGTMSATLVEQ